MPAKSQSQQAFMAMVYAYKKRDKKLSDFPEAIRDRIKDTAATIKQKDAKDYAETDTKGLPKKVKKEAVQKMRLREGKLGNLYIDKKGGKYELSISYNKGGRKQHVSDGSLNDMVDVAKELGYDELYINGEKIEERAKTMKLSNLIESKWFGEEEKPSIDEETRAKFMEAVKAFNKYGKFIYREGNLVELAKHFQKLTELATEITVQEGGDWFDQITIKRNMKELQNLGKDFAKVATDAQGLQDRMSALYEDMGNILNRYYEIEELNEGKKLNESATLSTMFWTGRPAKVQNLDWNGRPTLTEGEIKVGDRVKVDMKAIKNSRMAAGAKPWIGLVRKEIQYGGGTVEVVSIDGKTAKIAGSAMTKAMGPITVPVEALKQQ